MWLLSTTFGPPLLIPRDSRAGSSAKEYAAIRCWRTKAHIQCLIGHQLKVFHL